MLNIPSRLICVLVALCCFSLSGCVETARGEKIGIITKVAGQGTFITTTESEIIRGGLNAGSGVQGKSFEFTVQDPRIADQLRKAMNDQVEVRIVYRTEMFYFFSSESGGNFVEKVEIIEKKAPDILDGLVKRAGGVGSSCSALTVSLLQTLKQNNDAIATVLAAN